MLITFFFAARNDFARLFYMFCSISARVTGGADLPKSRDFGPCTQKPARKWNEMEQGAKEMKAQYKVKKKKKKK